MDIAIIAALSAAVGFAFADVANAQVSRHISGRTAMLVVSFLKILLYLPLLALWGGEFSAITAAAWLWIIPLGVVNAAAMYGFYIALQGKHPAVVGVIAGSFPAVSALVAIVFLGQRPSLVTVSMVAVVVIGIMMIGLPKDWHKHITWDKSLLLAIVPLVGWGVFTGLLAIPIGQLRTPHAWFTVQFIAVVIMVIFSGVASNRRMPTMLKSANNVRHAWQWVLAAAVLAGGGELLQSLALGAGHTNTTLTAALIGSYPAFYFLLANRVFKERLIRRQWVSIAVVLVAVVVLSASTT